MNETDARERILDAAEDLYYRKGYATVGMDELKTAAGVSLRRLYNLFPSKDAIVTAVLSRKHEEWENGIAARVARAGSSEREQLLAVYRYLEDWFCADDFRGCAFINAFGELGGTSVEIAELVRAHKSSFQSYMGELVSRVGGTPALAAQLAILAEGAQTTAAISGDAAPAVHARSAAEVLIDVALAA